MSVIALLILATTTGISGIGPAVFVHEGSTLVVIGNALRLMRYEAPDAHDMSAASGPRKTMTVPEQAAPI